MDHRHQRLGGSAAAIAGVPYGDRPTPRRPIVDCLFPYRLPPTVALAPKPLLLKDLGLVK